jgi:hypothetical protein
MEFSSYITEGTSLQGYASLRESVKTDDETMTDDVKFTNRGMNTRPPKDAETQIEVSKPPSKESGDISSFLQRVEPLISKELDKTSKAFQCNP